MGLRYKIPIPKTALSTTVSLVNIIPAAARATIVRRIYLGGQDIASAAMEIGIYRINAAGTGANGGTITPSPDNTAYPAYAGTVTKGAYATTQPTLGVTLQEAPLNTNGGVYYDPAANIELQGGQTGLTIRSIVGTGNVAGWIEIEEV